MNDDDMTLTDRAYGSLREDILNGVLAPGVRLRLDPLKARYGMGASPLREALSRLAGDGFVIAEGRRGFSVPPRLAERVARRNRKQGDDRNAGPALFAGTVGQDGSARVGGRHRGELLPPVQAG